MSDDNLLDAIRIIVRQVIREELDRPKVKAPKKRAKSRVQGNPANESAVILAGAFSGYMERTWPNVPFTPTYTWSKNFEYMLKAGISFVEIRRTIVWLETQNPGREFSFVIQSPKTFRERYGRILAQMEKPNGTASKTPQSGFLDGISSLAQDLGLKE